MSVTFFRSVDSDPPTVWDFLPPGRRGREPRRGLTRNQLEAFHQAVSVFDTFESAVENAEANGLGPYIAILRMESEGPIRWEQQGRNPHHYNLWGSFEQMRRAVIAVVRR